MKNIAVFALGLVLSCLLMIGFQQPYFKWVDSGGLSALSHAIDHELKNGVAAQSIPGLQVKPRPQGESEPETFKSSAATQEITKFAFYLGCIGIGMLLGMAIIWSAIILAVVISVCACGVALWYLALYAIPLLLLYFVGNYFTGGRIQNKVLAYLRITRESNQRSRNKFKEKLDKFFHPAKYDSRT